MASGELLYFYEEKYHTQKNVIATPEKYLHLVFIQGKSRQKWAPESHLWLKMDVASTPKYAI